MTPDVYLELIIFADPLMVETCGVREQLPACTLIPLLSEPIHLVADGIVRCAAVRFHAWAAGILFADANASARPWHDLSAEFAQLVAATTQVLRRGLWDGVAAFFDGALLPAFAAAQPGAAALTAAKTFARLPNAADAAAATPQVAARHGRSRRQIERQVRSTTHLSPKQLACLARFQFVRDTLWALPDTDLSALAFEAGYADQAHLTRHFRRYAGRSPGEFKRDCLHLRKFLAGQDVALVQDALAKRGESGRT